jgi:dihydropyrimidine dehydrogenase (NAD+) subunit PreA
MAVPDPILATRLHGFPLINPFLLASAPPTASCDLIRRAFQQGWAGAVTKTIKPDSMTVSDVSPRFAALRDGAGEVIGFENIELVSKKDEAYWAQTITDLKAEFPDRMVIASLMGDHHPATWRNLALAMEAAGADALELNFSCPHGMPEKGVGAAIGQDPAITAEITGWVKAVAKTPVIVKLTPNVTDIRVTAQAAVGAGADALAAINTVESITGVDLETFQPYPLVGGGLSAYGGYSGAGIKPLGLKAVARIASTQSVPIHGMGGIRTWSDAAEYLSLGATAVQVCTEVMVNGFGIIRALTDGLADYLRRKQLTGVADLQGRALAQLSSHEGLVRSVRALPAVRLESCVGCGKCLVACRDGGYQALTVKNKKAEVAPDRCDGCGLCALVCPHDALTMVQYAVAR